MASRHLPMQLLWTPTIPNSAGMAPWSLHCLLLISAWPQDLVTEQEGLFCRSLVLGPSQHTQPLAFWLAAGVSRSPPTPQSCAPPYWALPIQDNLPINTTAKASVKVMGRGQKIHPTLSHAFHSHIPPGRVGARTLGEAVPYLLAPSATARRLSWLPSTCLPPACKPRGSVQGVTGELAATQLWHPLTLLLNQALCTLCFCHDEPADIKEK